MKKLSIITTSSVVVASILGAVPAFAATNPAHGRPTMQPHKIQMKKTDTKNQNHPFFGKVTAVSGTSITMTTLSPTSTAYTIDASRAKFMKNEKTAGAITDIAVGNLIGVQGTSSGTNIAANAIMINGGGPENTNGAVGRGIAGKVTSISGNTFTIDSTPFHGRGMRGAATSTPVTPPAPVSYTVTADANTVYTKDGQPATINDVTTTSLIMVRGTTDPVAHTIAATNVMINTHIPTASSAPLAKKSLLGRVLGFFHKK